MPVEQSGNSNKKLKKRDRNWNLIDAGAGLWAWAWVYVSVYVSSFGLQKFRGRCTTQPEATLGREGERYWVAGRLLAGGNPSIDDFLKGSSDVEAVEKGEEGRRDRLRWLGSASLGACNKPSDFNACRPRCRCR